MTHTHTHTRKEHLSSELSLLPFDWETQRCLYILAVVLAVNIYNIYISLSLKVTT